MDRQNAGHDRHIDAGAPDPFDIAFIDVVVEKELGDCPGGASIDLALEHVDVGGEIRAFGMALGIGGN